MTQAEKIERAAQRYVEAHQRFSSNGASNAPAWLQQRRHAALARFADRGFPTTRQEAWRFTDIKPIAQSDFALAEEVPSMSRDALEPYLVGGAGRLTAVFVNGRYAPELSSTGTLPEGLQLGGLQAGLETHGEVIEHHLAQHALDTENPFTSLSTAFAHDGAFVLVPKDLVLDRPLQLLFVGANEGDRPLVWHPRTLIIVERGAQLSLVETYAGVGSGRYWTNAVTEVVVGENANVDTYRVQRESPGAFHTAATHSTQQRNSVYSLVTFAFGGGLTRHDLRAVLDGEGAEATLDGLSLLGDRQHVDHHTTLEHAKPHCNSWEYFNGIFDDRSRGVFNGRIIVRPGAQKTDSKQTNNNLLLSATARADSQPQLEIYADDVRCTHGATLGPIDDKQLFYLETRGLDPDAARRLLTYGFAAEILGNVTHEELRTSLDRVVKARLEG